MLEIRKAAREHETHKLVLEGQRAERKLSQQARSARSMEGQQPITRKKPRP